MSPEILIQRVTKKIHESPVALSGSDEATTEGQLHWLHLWEILHEKKEERIRKKNIEKATELEGNGHSSVPRNNHSQDSDL